jgi:hypothetical protein
MSLVLYTCNRSPNKAEKSITCMPIAQSLKVINSVAGIPTIVSFEFDAEP